MTTAFIEIVDGREALEREQPQEEETDRETL